VTPVTNWVCGKPWFRLVAPRWARLGERLLQRLPTDAVPPFLRGPYDGSLHASDVFETHEGHSIWNRFARTVPHHATTAAAATPDARADLHDVVRWHQRYHGRPRFLSKTPRNALRLPFLHAIFPDARFIHLVRDGRAVAASILKRRKADNGTLDEWWGAQPPGWQDTLSEPPIVQAAWTWETFLATVERDAADLPDGAMTQVTYETFTTEPDATLRRLFDATGLDPDVFFSASTRAHLDAIRPPSGAWRDRLDAEQHRLLTRLTPTLQRYGYDG